MKEKKSLKKYISNIISFANSRTRNVYRNRASEFYSSPVTEDLVELNRLVWQSVVGLDKEIITVRLAKSKVDKSLGISLFGQILVNEDGLVDFNPNAFNDLNCSQELVPARHYINEVREDTPVGMLPEGSVMPGDELLQANGLRIWGVSYKRAIRSLRTLPNYIELVLARSKVPIETEDYISREYELLQVAASEVNSICTNDEFASGYGIQSDMPFPLRSQMVASLIDSVPKSRIDTFKWIQDSCQNQQQHTNNSDPMNEEEELNALNNESGNISESLEAKRFDKIDELDTFRGSLGYIDKLKFSKNLKWSRVPLIIQMKKDLNGFGFSIAEFEEMSISNVDGGIRRHSTLKRDPRETFVGLAKRGRSIAADGHHPDAGRSLRSSPRRSFAGLDRPQVQTLPRKRHSVPRTSSLPNTKDLVKPSVLLIDSITKDGAAYKDGRLCIGDQLLFVNDRKLENSSQSEAVNALRSAPHGPVIIGVRKMLMGESPSQCQEIVPSKNEQPIFTERSYFKQIMDFNKDDSHETKHPEVHERLLQFEPILTTLEREEELDRHGKPLGLKLDALANGGIDGCRVIQVLKNGAISDSSKIQPDDYITQIEKYSLRYRDNVQVFQILRKLLLTKDRITLKYIQSSEIDRHRTDPSNKISDVARQNEFKSLKRCLITKFDSETSWGIRFFSENENATMIEHVIPKSPADRIQRINEGDMILEVNSVDFSSRGYEDVIKYIKKNESSNSLDLLLKSAQVEKAPVESSSVTEKTKPVNGLVKQLSIEKSYHSDIGRLEEPSPISECETKEILNIMSAHVDSETNYADFPPQKLRVKPIENIRGPVLFDTELEDSSNEHNHLENSHEAPIKLISPQEDSPKRVTSQANGVEEPNEDLPATNTEVGRYQEIVDVFIEVGPNVNHESLGLELVGTKDPLKKATIIHAIKPGSPASKGNIKIGDEIIEVNGENVINFNHTHVQGMILRLLPEKNPIHLLLNRGCNADKTSASPVTTESPGFKVPFQLPTEEKSPPTTRKEEKFEDFMEKFTVTLNKSHRGYGLHIVNSGLNDESGVFIKAITPNSPAFECAKFKEYDQILKVDDVTINDYDTALQCVKDKQRIQLVMSRKSKKPVDSTAPIMLSTKSAEEVMDSSKASKNLATSRTEIKEGVPTEIILEKEDNSLGFSIVGGKETILGSIMIHEIYEKSVAARDGRLWCADRILAINDIDITNYDHSEASCLIKSSSKTVKLKILRLPKLKTDDLDIVEVKLDRKQGRGLGLSIGSKPNDTNGAVIVEILNNTPACKSGRLLAGDIILKVDGMDVTCKSPDDVIAKLKTLKGEVNLEVGRPKMGAYPGFISKVKLFDIPLNANVHSLGEFDYGYHFLEHIFGIYLREATEDEFQMANNRLIVESLDPRSEAQNSCSIQPHDRLYAVDGEPIDWLSVSEVHFLFTLCNTLTLTLGRIYYYEFDHNKMISQITGDFLLTAHKVPVEAEESICSKVPGFKLNTPNEEDEGKDSTSPPSLCDSTDLVDNQGDDRTEPATEVPGFQKMKQISIFPLSSAHGKVPLGIVLEYQSGPSGPRVAEIQKASPAERSELSVGDRLFVIQNIMFNTLIESIEPTRENLTNILEEQWQRLPPNQPLDLFIVLNDRRASASQTYHYEKKAPSGFRTLPRPPNLIIQNTPNYLRNKSLTLDRNKNLPGFSPRNSIPSYN